MKRILLVEDDPSTQLLFKTRLEDLDYEVIVAPTGAMGLMEARASLFDLFLVDIGLGSGIDGYEVCRRFKALPSTATIPVVLISGRVKGQEELHVGYEAGCESYLVKGDLTLFEDVVRAMLRIKTLRDDLAVQNHLLEQQNRRLQEERQRGADLETALRESGGRSLVFRELAAGHPDGTIVVDGEGVIRIGDRGAHAILGKNIEGKHLATLAPDSGIEAFVRDARTDTHDSYRFDLRDNGGFVVRSLSATVIPMVSPADSISSPSRVVLLLDAGKRRVASEMLRLEQQGMPRNEMGPLLEAARGVFRPAALVGRSPAMVAVRERITTVANQNSPVLVRGESGTGKKLVARVLHYAGTAHGPFLSINCAALGSQQLEIELFGYVKGAFPDALIDRPGLFGQAGQGTVFLDEIEELSMPLQAKLLGVIENGEVVRMGSKHSERMEARIVASTSVEIEPLCQIGRFRKDLLYRLGVVDIRIPPLAERLEDVEPLVDLFLRRFASTNAPRRFSDDALWLLTQHDWPGNARELRNCVESACGLAKSEEIVIDDLPQSLVDLYRRLDEKEIPAAIPGRLSEGLEKGLGVAAGRFAPEDPYAAGEDDEQEIGLAVWERRGLLDALQRTGGDKLAAARLLKVGKSTFYRKLKNHGIT
jgi:DNA-binding NtrC family response regulator